MGSRSVLGLVVVDRYLPSSQLHHGCTTRLAGAKLAKRLTCDTCHVEVDRDENASLNIRDWSVISPGLVESTALFVLGPFGTGGSSDDGMTHHLEIEHVRPVAILAVLGEARTTLGRVSMKSETRTF
ncbi:zinc ribbon domain-containing protein [Ferrimicrobium acidiphilum]|uniref:Putative transposase DNA-binding domain protein n=1 Tax=Ferrimicrobium acidiphilum DSM 19497 TaxID=1121877 RepID=A0A0D8FRE3_9ACTN|nr:zinc ribbon domain-containing protein [Ferrimicrobium acidiphilum]KJE75848.1 putative transposase DNA-binding domain protein [Ferrimicrobium acidiphilum DSM 19497]